MSYVERRLTSARNTHHHLLSKVTDPMFTRIIQPHAVHHARPVLVERKDRALRETELRHTDFHPSFHHDDGHREETFNRLQFDAFSNQPSVELLGGLFKSAEERKKERGDKLRAGYIKHREHVDQYWDRIIRAINDLQVVNGKLIAELKHVDWRKVDFTQSVGDQTLSASSMLTGLKATNGVTTYAKHLLAMDLNKALHDKMFIVRYIKPPTTPTSTGFRVDWDDEKNRVLLLPEYNYRNSRMEIQRGKASEMGYDITSVTNILSELVKIQSTTHELAGLKDKFIEQGNRATEIYIENVIMKGTPESSDLFNDVAFDIWDLYDDCLRMTISRYVTHALATIKKLGGVHTATAKLKNVTK